MNARETARLLALCASYDRRKVGEADVLAWHRVIGDLPFADCEQAVIAYYTENDGWIMPVHVRDRVRDIRDARLEASPPPPPPPELTDDLDAYSAALHASRVAVADGRDPAAAMRQVTRSHLREIEAP